MDRSKRDLTACKVLIIVMLIPLFNTNRSKAQESPIPVQLLREPLRAVFENLKEEAYWVDLLSSTAVVIEVQFDPEAVSVIEKDPVQREMFVKGSLSQLILEDVARFRKALKLTEGDLLTLGMVVIDVHKNFVLKDEKEIACDHGIYRKGDSFVKSRERKKGKIDNTTSEEAVTVFINRRFERQPQGDGKMKDPIAQVKLTFVYLLCQNSKSTTINKTVGLVIKDPINPINRKKYPLPWQLMKSND